MATFFDAIRQGAVKRIDDAIRGAEYNRLLDTNTREQAASRLASGQRELRGLAQQYAETEGVSEDLKNFATGKNPYFNSKVLQEVDSLAGDRFNATAFLNDTLFSPAATGNNRTALAGFGLDFDKQEVALDLMSRTPQGVIQAPVTQNGQKFAEGGQPIGLKIGELDRMLNAYQTNLTPSVGTLTEGFSLTDPNASVPGAGPTKPALVKKLEDNPDYQLTKEEEAQLLKDPYVKKLFEDQNINSVEDLGKPGTFNNTGQALNLNRQNIEESLREGEGFQYDFEVDGKDRTFTFDNKRGKPIGKNLGILLMPSDPLRQKGYKRIFTTEKIAEKLGVSVEKAKEFEKLLYDKSVRNLSINRPFRDDPQDWLLENVSPELLASKSKLFKRSSSSPIGRALATNALVREIAGGPGKVNLKFETPELTNEEKADIKAAKNKNVSQDTVASIIRKAVEKAGSDGVADLSYLPREARTNLYFQTLTGINPELKNDPNFWKSMNSLLGTGYLPVQLDLFKESSANRRVATQAAQDDRRDLRNFTTNTAFTTARDQGAKYSIMDAGKLEDQIVRSEFQDALSLWNAFLETDADTVARIKAAQPVTNDFITGIVNGQTKRGFAGALQSFFRGEARTGPFDSSNVKVLMTVNTPEGIVQLRDDAKSREIAQALIDNVRGYSVESVQRVTAGGSQRGKTMTAGELAVFGDKLIPYLLGNAMIQGERIAKAQSR